MIYPEAFVAAGLIRENNLLIPLRKKLFRGMNRYADQIIVLGRDMREIISINSTCKINIICNWSDVETVKPESKK